MRPIIEDDIDEEEGLDTLSSLPPSPTARPSLNGLERELSSKFGASVENNNNTSNGGQHQQNIMSYTDYLHAQKRMQSRRHLVGASAQQKLLRRLSSVSDDDGGDGDGGETTTTATTAGGGAQQSVQTNLTVLTAAAKLRRRADNNKKNAQEQKTLRALEAWGRRGSTTNLMTPDEAVQWDVIFSEMDAIDEDGHFVDHDHHHVVPWYSPPIQRQRWNQDQILPHVNWGDLFFDLFYVAMAYNLGVMLVSAMNSDNWLRGIIYYVGSFGPLWNSWELSMLYESRYTTVDNYHRLFEVVRYLFVSTAVVHVKSVDLFADPSSTETLLFTCAILGESIMHLILNLELYFWGQGDREAIQKHTMRMLQIQFIPTMLVYLSAVIIAGVFYSQSKKDGQGGGYRLLAEVAEITAADKYTSSEASYYPEPLFSVYDVPLTLMAVGYLLSIALYTLRMISASSGKYGDFRTGFVPYNVDYVIHRYGEWILLMIGEGILSLLIVETAEVKDYYIITTFGVITIIFIQILKFESEPSHGDGHAMWRNLLNGMCYSMLIQLLSMALIVFGVTYKVFLKDVVEDAEKDEDYDYGTATRLLAASPAVDDEVSAAVFSGSLCVVLLSLEVMCLTHGGIKKSLRSLQKTEDNSPNWPVIIIALFKVAIILFTATLCEWTIDSAVLTLSGCGVVFALAVTRVVNFVFTQKREVVENLTNTVRTTVGRAKETTKRASVAYSKMTTKSEMVEKQPNSDAVAQSTATNIRKSDGDVSSHNNESASGTTSELEGINNSFDAIVVADLNGIMTQVNETAVKLFGYSSKQEMVGKNLSIIVGGGDSKRHDGYVKAFKKRVHEHVNPGQKILGQQRMLTACRADGTEFPCIIGIKMVSNDTRVAGYIKDISEVVSNEKKRVTKTMNSNKNELLLRVVDDHAFDAIIACNDHGIIQKVNDAAVKEFGYDNKGELVGMDLSMLIHSITTKQLKASHGEQRVVSLTKKNGLDFQSIVASKKIKDTDDMFVSYVRNIDDLKSSFKFD